MNLDKVQQHVHGLPYMQRKQADRLRKILHIYKPSQCLELGFFHGVSSMYTCAILDELGDERTLTSIDKEVARGFSPNINNLATDLGFEGMLEVHFEPRTYLWRLKAFIEEGRTFDFCYLDGGHNWGDTGFAFFLLDKILKPGGLILFDDFNWTAEGKEWAADWPLDEQKSKPVERVWELLVADHPAYRQVWQKGNWALAQKKRKLPLLPVYI